MKHQFDVIDVLIRMPTWPFVAVCVTVGVLGWLLSCARQP